MFALKPRIMSHIASVALGGLLLIGQNAGVQAADGRSGVSSVTKVIFLGTGFPRPDPRAMGPSLAIVVGEKSYIVDAGAGVVRRAAEAFESGENALAVNRLETVFITHLHSDHTLGLPDLLLTPWTVGRTKPLTVIGPKGTSKMMNSIEQAWSEDIQMRIGGGEGGNKTGYQFNAKEVESGPVFDDGTVKVTAFRVHHGSWDEALGYRFDTPDKSIVISGDTTALPEVMKEACHGCDILIHEAFAGEGVIENTFTKKDSGPSKANWSEYMAKFHTSAYNVGLVAKAARPKLLILDHTIPLGKATDEDFLRDVRTSFDGRTEIAKDLAKY